MRQAAAEMSHDFAGIDAVLARAVPDPVFFVARAYRFWGREAVLEHFRTTFEGTWRFEPDESALRTIAMGPDTMSVYAPTKITLGAGGRPSATYTFLVTEVRTPDGWRIAAMIPVPAP